MPSELEEYKQQILDHFSHVLELQDVADSPNYQTMLTIQSKLVQRGIPGHLASRAVTQAHIVVADSIFSDTMFMNMVTDNFAEVIVRIYHFSLRFNDDQCFLNLVDGMSLTLTPPTE